MSGDMPKSHAKYALAEGVNRAECSTLKPTAVRADCSVVLRQRHVKAKLLSCQKGVKVLSPDIPGIWCGEDHAPSAHNRPGGSLVRTSDTNFVSPPPRHAVVVAVIITFYLLPSTPTPLSWSS